MKKILVSAIALMMVLAMVMGVSAVAEESIVGNWMLDIDAILEQMAAGYGMTLDDLKAALGDELDTLAASMSYNFIFNEDGTFVMILVAEGEEMKIGGTYTVAEGQIIMTPTEFPDQPETFAYSFTEDGKLVLNIDGGDLVFYNVPANEAEAPAA